MAVKDFKPIVNEFVTNSLILGTFSEKGPKKCSGLNITKYSQEKLVDTFTQYFNLQEGHEETCRETCRESGHLRIGKQFLLWKQDAETVGGK